MVMVRYRDFLAPSRKCIVGTALVLRKIQIYQVLLLLIYGCTVDAEHKEPQDFNIARKIESLGIFIHRCKISLIITSVIAMHHWPNGLRRWCNILVFG